MSESQVFLCDVDRTLVGPGGVETAVVAAIRDHRLAGNYVSAVTGGPLAYAGDMICGLGITDPCALAGGAQIYDPYRDRIIEQRNMLTDDLDMIRSRLSAIAVGRLVFNNFSRQDHREGGVWPGSLPVGDEPVYFANITGLDQPTADRIVTDLQAQGLQRTAVIRAVASYDRTKAEVHFTDIVATKKYACLRILELLDMSPDTATVMGDADNDLPMFEAVGWRGTKVAMGNASSLLKQAADVVIDDIDLNPAAAGAYLRSCLDVLRENH